METKTVTSVALVLVSSAVCVLIPKAQQSLGFQGQKSDRSREGGLPEQNVQKSL